MLGRLRPHGYTIGITEGEAEECGFDGYKAVLDNDEEGPFRTEADATAKLLEMKEARDARRRL